MTKEQQDMEALVHWAYGRQKAHMAARSGGGQCGPMAYGSAWLGFARLLELGTLIDDGGSGEGTGGDKCPNDALTIHGRALSLLPADGWWLVYQHGLSMTRPDWYAEGVGHEVPVLNGKGQRKPIYRDAVNRTGIIGYETCWQGHRPEAVARARAEYTLWHESLCALAADLADRLDDFTPVAPLCDAAPWGCEAGNLALSA